MARLTRVSPIGIPQHIIQRGNNRQICFGSEQDMKAYMNWLKDFSVKYDVSIHAWVLMTNHIHLLCTPNKAAAISKMMQSLGRMYVGYYNHTHGRTGTLWDGRFKSCLVQSEQYLLTLQRYIELNPVRANMVEEPSQYSWSSYGCHGLGLKSELNTPHEQYELLAATEEQRQESYRALFKSHINVDLITDIRNSVNKGLALGSERFSNDIEQLTKQRVSARQAGRPKKKAEF